MPVATASEVVIYEGAGASDVDWQEAMINCLTDGGFGAHVGKNDGVQPDAGLDPAARDKYARAATDCLEEPAHDG